MQGASKYILFSLVIGYSCLGFASETIYYTTNISNNDRYNSHGDRLTTVAEILRQDRANVYKFGLADQGDQRDGYFYLKNRREAFVNARIKVANRHLLIKIISSRKPVWISVCYTPRKNVVTVYQPD